MPSLDWAAESSSYYTLLFVDAAASLKRTFVHWFVVNIPGNDIEKGELKAR